MFQNIKTVIENKIIYLMLKHIWEDFLLLVPYVVEASGQVPTLVQLGELVI